MPSLGRHGQRCCTGRERATGDAVVVSVQPVRVGGRAALRNEVVLRLGLVEKSEQSFSAAALTEAPAGTVSHSETRNDIAGIRHNANEGRRGFSGQLL